MKITPLDIPDVILLEPNLYEDERGFFYESFNQRDFIEATGASLNFVQDNHSKSKKGVLRGLHFQLPPFAQGKLVRVIQGEVYDVAVDIRNNSPTFGKWVGQSLNAVDKQSMWIPPGFAHGFLTLSGTAELLYKTTEYYSSEYEKCIIWNDPQINISWPYKTDLCMSFRDKKGLKLEDIIAVL